MISVRKKADGSWEPVSGAMRLRALLDLNGQASVRDVATGAEFIVHEVGEHILMVSAKDDANLEDLANAAINHARHTSDPNS